jgi:hypothetical protein
VLEAPVGFLEMWSSRLATPCSNSARNAIQAVMPGFEDATHFFLGRWSNRIGPGTSCESAWKHISGEPGARRIA